MNRLLFTRALFAFAGLYDLGIGFTILVAGPAIFRTFGVPEPNVNYFGQQIGGNWGYIHFCCLLLMIFGAMFLTVAYAPEQNRNLIPFGVLLKLSYIWLVGVYWLTERVPWLFLPFWLLDLLMLVGFVLSYLWLGPNPIASFLPPASRDPRATPPVE